MEKPILFSTKMVQAILEGRKTQTRRVIKPYPTILDNYSTDILTKLKPQKRKQYEYFGNKDIEISLNPYTQIGTILWVRETWTDIKISDNPAYNVQYKADYIDEFSKKMKWKPSIYMPKKYCRLWLEVIDVRVEKVQNITEYDAKAEGIKDFKEDDDPSAYIGFKQLWDSINEKRGYGWTTNPWVWVVEFKKVEKGE